MINVRTDEIRMEFESLYRRMKRLCNERIPVSEVTAAAAPSGACAWGQRGG
jgi:hypothetical protein